MAERDIGSTFFLPHSHLYKTEKVNIFISMDRIQYYKKIFFLAGERFIWF